MKKALKISGGVVTAFVLLMLIIPLIFQEQINREIKKMANRTLKSEMNYTGVSLSFFKHFPNLSFTLDGFSLKSSAPFDNDTLIKAKEIAFGLNVGSLFGQTIRINRIYFEKAQINIRYNENGTSNYDVYQHGDTTAKRDTTGSTANLKIEQIILSDCKVVYSDLSIPVEVVADGLNYSGSSNISGDLIDLASKVTINKLDVSYDHVKYIDSKPVTAKLSTKINSRDLTVNLEKNDLKIKDIPLEFHGKFNFEKDGYQVNLNFLSIMEKEFMSARFKVKQGKDLWLFAKVNASIDAGRWAKALDVKVAEIRGFYEMNLLADGSYATGTVKKGIRNEVDTVVVSIPKFTLMTRLKDGYFKYASLPQPLTGINFQLNASCPDHQMENISVQLDNLEASLLKNKITGYFRLNNLRNFPIDANLQGSCNLAELKQALPLDSISLAGTLALDVKVKGNYVPDKKQFPVTNAAISLKDGFLQTRYYPHPLEKVTVDALVTNTTGTMNSLKVKISPFTFQFEGQPFTLNALLENFDDLQYDVTSKGVIDVGKVYQVFSRKEMELDGFIETSLSLKGRQSDAVAGRVGRLHNSGILKLRDIALVATNYPRPFIIKTGTFRFDQDKMWFDNFLATYGTSDFRLKGWLRNTINYILSQGGTLTGSFELNSNKINIDEFKALSPVKEEVTYIEKAESGVVIIPRNLDIDFKAQIAGTSFEGLDIKNLKGEINLKEGILVLKGASFNLIGCDVNMEATYGSITPVKGFFDFHVKAEDFDIKRAYNEVAMIREMATSAGKAEGIVSLDYTVKGMLNAEMFPVMNSLEGGGVLSVKKVRVYGLKLFNDISKGTEKESIKNPDVSKVDIHSTVKNNTITLEQFKFKVKGIRVKIAGTTSFDNKLNLKIRLGLGPLGIIGIPMKITGTTDDPKIKYGRGKESEDLKDSEYSDQLPQEMLDRIRSAKEDPGEEESEK